MMEFGGKLIDHLEGHEMSVTIKAEIRCETCNKKLDEQEIPGGFRFTSPTIKKSN